LRMNGVSGGVNSKSAVPFSCFPAALLTVSVESI
jgi:hypothetical protein